ncbi:MAG: hypothetical protein E7016_02995 [Alphaproteobacteria bacterium]|nr:hypothetical protein [Alphaproteobacteria bacterium]
MIKKFSLYLLAIGAGLTASCTNPFHANSVQRAEHWQPQIDLPSSVVVCRQKQCAPAKLSMSKEYIYNSLLHLLDNNSQDKALLCRADAASHVCTQNYLTIPVTVGVTPANMYIDNVKITDVSASIGNQSLDVILNYNVTYNGQTPTCKPAKSLVYVKNANNIVMEDAGYSCKMTTIGNTTIKTLFAIDYIDLDYGYIGGYYSIGLSGPAFGGDSGYMLMRLPNDAYPLSPDLIFKQEQTPAPKAVQMVLDPNGEPVYVEVNQTAAGASASVINATDPTSKTRVQPKRFSDVATTVTTATTPMESVTTTTKTETKKAKTKTQEPYEGVQVFPINNKKKAE